MFLAMAVILILRPWGLLGRPSETGRARGIASVELPPPAGRGRPGPRLDGLVVVLRLLPLAADDYTLVLAVEVLIYALFAASLNVMIGFTGQHLVRPRRLLRHRRLCRGAARTTSAGRWPPPCRRRCWPGWWPLVGYFCVRLTQIYFAMLTLAFAMLVWGVAFKWKDVTGGDDGFTGIKLPAMLAHHVGTSTLTLRRGAGRGGALCVRCSFGRSARAGAVRESSVRAGLIGVDMRAPAWPAFTVAGTFAGLAGALFGMYHRGMYIENAFGRIGRRADHGAAGRHPVLRRADRRRRRAPPARRPSPTVHATTGRRCSADSSCW